ncbi:MAG: hypothetical protein FJ288_15540 [Planctomycetes bacterium]|nr:hypothetical protein [Planctomycetota bacterium]
MADIALTQAEADALIAMPKCRVNDDPWDYPGMGGAICVPLVSQDKREGFFLDISRGRIDLLKGKYQNRGRQVVILVRLDFGNPCHRHRNPDDTELAGAHIHVYREGYADKWAVPVPHDKFPNLADLWQTLQDFMKYCNVTERPNIRRGLFP